MATRLRTVMCLQIVQDAAGAGQQDFTCTLGFEMFDVVLFVTAGTAFTGSASIQRQPAAGGGFNNAIGGAGILNASSTGSVQRTDSLVAAQTRFAVGDTIRLVTLGGTTRVVANVMLLPDNSNNATST